MAPGLGETNDATFEQLQAYISYEDAAAVRAIAKNWKQFQDSIDDAENSLSGGSAQLFGASGWTGAAADAFQGKQQQVLTSLRSTEATTAYQSLDKLADRIASTEAAMRQLQQEWTQRMGAAQTAGSNLNISHYTTDDSTYRSYVSTRTYRLNVAGVSSTVVLNVPQGAKDPAIQSAFNSAVGDLVRQVQDEIRRDLTQRARSVMGLLEEAYESASGAVQGLPFRFVGPTVPVPGPVQVPGIRPGGLPPGAISPGSPVGNDGGLRPGDVAVPRTPGEPGAGPRGVDGLRPGDVVIPTAPGDVPGSDGGGLRPGDIVVPSAAGDPTPRNAGELRPGDILIPGGGPRTGPDGRPGGSRPGDSLVPGALGAPGTGSPGGLRPGDIRVPGAPGSGVPGGGLRPGDIQVPRADGNPGSGSPAERLRPGDVLLPDAGGDPGSTSPGEGIRPGDVLLPGTGPDGQGGPGLPADPALRGVLGAGGIELPTQFSSATPTEFAGGDGLGITGSAPTMGLVGNDAGMGAPPIPPTGNMAANNQRSAKETGGGPGGTGAPPGMPSALGGRRTGDRERRQSIGFDAMVRLHQPETTRVSRPQVAGRGGDRAVQVARLPVLPGDEPVPPTDQGDATGVHLGRNHLAAPTPEVLGATVVRDVPTDTPLVPAVPSVPRAADLAGRRRETRDRNVVVVPETQVDAVSGRGVEPASGADPVRRTRGSLADRTERVDEQLWTGGDREVTGLVDTPAGRVVEPDQRAVLGLPTAGRSKPKRRRSGRVKAPVPRPVDTARHDPATQPRPAAGGERRDEQRGGGMPTGT